MENFEGYLCRERSTWSHFGGHCHQQGPSVNIPLRTAACAIFVKVDECLSAWEKDRAPAEGAALDPLHRCVVCTLPHGSCEHTKEWLDDRARPPILKPLPKDNVDFALDDISDVLTPVSLVSKTVNADRGDPSLGNLRWETLCAQPADELSGRKVDLSSPSSRSGHTMVVLNGADNLREDTRLLVVFGGVSTTNPDHPLGAHLAEKDPTCNSDCDDAGDAMGIGDAGIRQHPLHYHAEVRVFNIGLSTWHYPDTSGDLPEGRYGHTALALDRETMWMFGGRLQGGLQVGDTQTLDVREMRWHRTNNEGDGDLNPAPRFWSSAVKVREQVVLFGGADLLNERVFDDVWTWDVKTERWTEQIVVGTPPLARYGHVLLACPQGQLLVLGGCCVSTSAEEGLPPDHDRLHLRVRVAAGLVDRAYKLEEAEIAVGAFDSYQELGGLVPESLSGPDSHSCEGGSTLWASRTKDSCRSEKERWRSLARRQAQLAAAIAARENDTNLREEELREVLYEQAAMTYWAKLRSQHPFKELDMTFLDTENMIWGVSNPPAVGGGKTTSPSARMHFSAVVLGQKVVLWGGCLPTSKRVKTVEGDVHVFDLDHLRWSTPVGKEHPEGIRPRLDAAVGQLRRAQRALFEATQRAMTLGAPGGRTMQVVQAEAGVEVNRWRVKKIEDEVQNAIPSPESRGQHAGCAIGHRVMYFGGLGAETEKGALLVLDIEQPHEKERRLEEEFHMRLERERQQREAAEAEALRRAARQEEMRKGLELAREAAETEFMSAEDARSAIAELTMAPTPRLRCANSTTLWLEWDPPSTDAVGKPPDCRLEYTLYMSGGFREWEVGDRVLVEYMSRAQRKAAASNSTITTSSVTDAGSLAGGSLSEGSSFFGDDQQRLSSVGGGSVESATGREPLPNLLPAEITATSVAGGLFDIRWNDGERERGVRRSRIHRAASPSPPWTIIYRGTDCHYAVEGTVPESVVERERNFPYEASAKFSLQTKGTEVPRDRLSRHSPVVTLRTIFDGQGPLGEGGWSEKRAGRSTTSMKARLATAKALDDSISASQSCSSGVRSLHGQYLATGKGGSYL
ncbi:unnamed protein product [Ectocarpus sp. 12 AP-2014]